MAQSDGSITFSTRLDNGDLEKQLKDTERKIESLKSKIENETTKRSFLEQEMDRAQKAIEAASNKTERLRERLEDLRNADPTDAEKWHRAQREVESLSKRLEEAEKRELELATQKEGLDKKWQEATDRINVYEGKLEHVKERHANLASEYAKSYSKASQTIDTALTKSRKMVDELGSRFSTMAKRVLVFGVILSALNSIRKGLWGAISDNTQFAATWESLKATMQGVAVGIANVVVPTIAAAVNAATAMILNLARVVDKVFGTRIVEAINASRAAAEGSWRQTDAYKQAVDDEQDRINELARAEERQASEQQRAAERAAKAEEQQAKAAQRLEKAQKKANQQIMAFDELNKLAGDSSEDITDAMDDYVDAIEIEGIDPALYDAIDPSEYLQPNWDAFDVGKIDAKLAEIMVILGAALMAVGAILCFSGINIPLGLTLMAIGALMIYTAYQEAWDKLPEETRNAISNAIAITGIVLLVLGAVLAFSGVNIALGIGMMAAGALLLYTAIALNWEKLPEDVQAAITAVMVIVGSALLVVGAILALSGANIALGIGLMAIGALTLGAAAALNWETLREHIDEVIPLIAASLSAALLVVGAILTFSAASMPLGIGLMAAGAVGLAATAYINWGKMPDQIKGTISAIEPVVAAALLVLGAVLTFSAANPPLGIALLVLGAATLAHALFLNWDNIPSSVKGAVVTIEAIVAPALLVLGAVITFSAANPALGIALLVAGAVALTHSIILNWETIPGNVRNAIVTIEAVVAPALLVLGAVLTFSAANIPLGIALLAAGAISLVHLATLNWDEMPEHIRSLVSTILGIVGGALIVIGIILCATGVALPIGIACIAAGAVSLVAAAAINWDFIVDKVKEIWGKIKEFWNNNIRPVFTWEFWSNIFKGFVNGLIHQINNGLDAFSGFINDLAGGVCDILDFFGVGGYTFRIGIPHIPYLAQGAVIPPNREFMAVLGDQRSGNNIETPESLMRQVVREETGPLLADMVAALLAGNQGDTRDVVLVVGRKELARETLRGVRELQDTGELGASGIVFG